jgi:ribonuclease HII
MKKDVSRFIFDLDLIETNNVKWIIGLDEVGYGCFAGDLVVGAVAISSDFIKDYKHYVESYPFLMKIKDSKKVSEKNRNSLDKALHSDIIEKHLFYHNIGIGSVKEINELGVSPTHNLATERALLGLLEKNPDIASSNLIVLDGNKIDECLKNRNIITIVKGDNKSFSIATASILAKVFRDNQIKNLPEKYNAYNFKKNKGYGTPDHITEIIKSGITDQHRLKYCKNFIK